MASASADLDMHAVFASKQEDRVIHIYIGTDPRPLQMPESVLLRTSDYFRGLLKRGFKESSGSIHKPDDDITAWKILTFWMTERELPLKDCIEAQLIKAWYLADYMNITQFQDDIMFELLNNAIADCTNSAEFDALLSLTCAGSLPRKLYAELMMSRVMDKDAQFIGWEDIKVFQENDDYAADLLAAAIAVGSNVDLQDVAWIPENYDDQGKPIWLRWMAGETGTKKMSLWGWILSEEGGWYGRYADD